MRAPHEQRAWIGDCRAACFRHEAGVGPGEDRREQFVDFASGRVHIQLANLDFLDRPLSADFLQKRARRLGVFADVVAKRSGLRPHGGGQNGGERVRVAFTEGIGNQVENAAHRAPKRG